MGNSEYTIMRKRQALFAVVNETLGSDEMFYAVTPSPLTFSNKADAVTFAQGLCTRYGSLFVKGPKGGLSAVQATKKKTK